MMKIIMFYRDIYLFITLNNSFLFLCIVNIRLLKYLYLKAIFYIVIQIILLSYHRFGIILCYIFFSYIMALGLRYLMRFIKYQLVRNNMELGDSLLINLIYQHIAAKYSPKI